VIKRAALSTTIDFCLDFKIGRCGAINRTRMHGKSTSERESVIKTDLLSSFSNNKLKKKGKRLLTYYLIDLKGFIRIRVYTIIDIKGLSLYIKTV
jgi:hypothetical protein